MGKDEIIRRMARMGHDRWSKPADLSIFPVNMLYRIIKAIHRRRRLIVSSGAQTYSGTKTHEEIHFRLLLDVFCFVKGRVFIIQFHVMMELISGTDHVATPLCSMLAR